MCLLRPLLHSHTLHSSAAVTELGRQRSLVVVSKSEHRSTDVKTTLQKPQSQSVASRPTPVSWVRSTRPLRTCGLTCGGCGRWTTGAGGDGASWRSGSAASSAAPGAWDPADPAQREPGPPSGREERRPCWRSFRGEKDRFVHHLSGQETHGQSADQHDGSAINRTGRIWWNKFTCWWTSVLPTGNVWTVPQLYDRYLFNQWPPIRAVLKPWCECQSAPSFCGTQN